MKLKAEKTMRGVPHAHHGDSGRSLWKVDAWGGVPRTHYGRDLEDEPTMAGDDDGSPYPPALLETFKSAANKCPSIALDPAIMNGRPCIAGTRIPVHSVLRAIEQYGSLEKAVKCYPHLTLPQVKDALYFAQIVLEPVDGIDETETTA